MRAKRSVLCCVLAVLAWVVAPQAVHAAAPSIYVSGGFEAPRFSTAFVNGLDPTVIGNLRAQDAAVSTWRESTTDPSGANGASTGTAVVELKAGGSGSDLQDVKVTRTQYDNRWAPGVIYSSTPADPIRVVHWSMKVTQTTTDPSKYGPFFGVETYDATGGPALRIAGFGVDSTTGEVLFEDPSIGGFNITPSDAVVAFDTYNDFDLTMNYTTQKASIALNGTTLMSNISFFNAVTGLTDADISALQADAVLFNNSGTAYFDNFSIVPEPASCVSCGLLLGMSVLRVRRRR